MTTIGYATLQIIPSLRGVTDAIEKDIDGKVVNVTIEPKVDQRKAEAAAKQTRETVEKQTTQVKVEPKVDKRAAEQAGEAAGEAVTKGATDAVERSSPGKDLAKVLVDGIADGVKGELRGGPLVDEFVDGLADGVKQGIDRGGVSKSILDSISTSLKSGNVGETIKSAVLPGITGIGPAIRGSVGEWSSGIANALRSGEIFGATADVKKAILATTTDAIGEITGLKGALNSVDVGPVQNGLQNVSDVLSGFDKNGDSGLERALGKVGGHAGNLAGMVGNAQALINLLNDPKTEEALNKIPGMGVAKDVIANKPAEAGTGVRQWIHDKVGITLPDVSKWEGFRNFPKKEEPIVYVGGDGTFDIGGYTGNLPVDKIAGVVHGKEYVVQATSQERIESDHPGLLDHLNKTGKLPGYAGGGLVTGAQQLRSIISEKFGISNIGGYRAADGFNEHSTGRALDVMVGNNKSQGDSVKDFALSNASAIDLKWVIWRQHLYYPGGGGYDMPDRGSPTQNHMDHVHIFSGTGIANGLRGALKGQQAQRQPTAAAPGAIDPASSDQAGAATSDATLVSSTSGSPGGGGVSVPSSLSGLSSFGLDSLGVTTSTQIGKGSQERTFDVGGAASSAVSGQVSSALGVLGVGDTPGWLQGISKFVGGISVSDSSGKKVFDGSALGGTGSAGSLFGGAAPVAASAPVGPAQVPGGTVHGGQAGRQPGPAGPTYNIRTALTEDAFVQAQQQEKIRLASKLDRY